MLGSLASDHAIHFGPGISRQEPVQDETICPAGKAVAAQQHHGLVEVAAVCVAQQWVGDQDASLLGYCLKPDLRSAHVMSIAAVQTQHM